MIDAGGLLNITETKQIDNVVFATVTGLSEEGTQVQFNSDDAPSKKKYKRMGFYTAKIGDYVLMLKKGNSYVIIGDIVN